MTALFLVAAGLLVWILNTNGKRDSTARGELRGDNRLARRAGFHEIVEDAVCDGFVEGVLIAIGSEIKFERFAFDAETIGHVINIDPCKIRLACYRA